MILNFIYKINHAKDIILENIYPEFIYEINHYEAIFYKIQLVKKIRYTIKKIIKKVSGY